MCNSQKMFSQDQVKVLLRGLSILRQDIDTSDIDDLRIVSGLEMKLQPLLDNKNVC